MTIPASQRYKDIVARATTAVFDMRQRDRERADELERELAEAKRRLTAAEERGEHVRAAVVAYWEAAVSDLWEERWLTIGPIPKPEESPETLDPVAAEARLAEAYATLQQAIHKRGLLNRR